MSVNSLSRHGRDDGTADTCSFFLASSSGVPGALQGCCLSGMLGVIKLFLDGCLALFGAGVLGVLRLVLGVFTLCCVGVLRGVFWDDLVLDGVFVAGLPLGVSCIEVNVVNFFEDLKPPLPGVGLL